MKEIWSKVKDYVYLISLIGIGSGWVVDHKITKFKNEANEQSQNAKIAAQAEEIRLLTLETKKTEGYAKQNANNIDWLTAIVGLDLD